MEPKLLAHFQLRLAKLCPWCVDPSSKEAHPPNGRRHKLAADADGIQQHGQAAACTLRLVLLGQDPGAERQGVGLHRGKAGKHSSEPGLLLALGTQHW